jgi:hypothetical protein
MVGLDAQTPDLLEAHRPKKPDTPKSDVRVSGYGNDASYALARLRRDHPELAARVEAGEVSGSQERFTAGWPRHELVQKKRDQATPWPKT